MCKLQYCTIKYGQTMTTDRKPTYTITNYKNKAYNECLIFIYNTYITQRQQILYKNDILP